MMINTTDIKDSWAKIKSNLQDIFSPDAYSTWFESLEVHSYNGDQVTLSVPNNFAAIWIQDNYHDILLKHLQMALGQSIKLSYEVLPQEEPIETPPPPPQQKSTVAYNNRLPKASKIEAESPFNRLKKTQKSSVSDTPYLLNPRNTFENFIVGAGNQLAHAACVAVANAPAKAYNPLFLYGDTGLGKTHLMHAVAHTILNNKPNAKVAYVSTEKFTNEFIRAIQDNTLVQFRQRYRNVDILLIDDIHFLSGKERIQEEFFHTFNDLFGQGQIFLSSDRPASEISKLESRLISRFQWGLVSDIQPPDFETRVAILSKKASTLNLNVPENIITYLAERVSRNVRRMEGALNRVAGYVALINGPIDEASIEKLLKDILQEEAQNQITIQKVQAKISEHFQLRPSDMESKRRPANIAFPRQIAMYLCRTLTNFSLKDIGNAFGGRDHGTVIHACKVVENMMHQDESIKRKVEYLQSHLTSNR